MLEMKSEDDLVPFPWSTCGSSERGKVQPKKDNVPTIKQTQPQKNQQALAVDPIIKNPKWKSQPSLGSISLHLDGCQNLTEIYKKCTQLGCIRFALPAYGALSGRVLRRAIRQVEELFKQRKPMIWKIGYRHNPFWRWANDMYGYARDRDKWSHMVVLYVSREPFSLSMLEAALIEKFQGHLAASLVIMD